MPKLVRDPQTTRGYRNMPEASQERSPRAGRRARSGGRYADPVWRELGDGAVPPLERGVEHVRGGRDARRTHDDVRDGTTSLFAALDVHLVLDDHATHKTPAIQRWFATLTERCIRRGTHRSTRELKRAIHEYLSANNEDPKPFIGTKTADEILRSLAPFCGRISGSRR